MRRHLYKVSGRISAIAAASSSVNPSEIDSAMEAVSSAVRFDGAPSFRRPRLERFPLGCVAVEDMICMWPLCHPSTPLLRFAASGLIGFLGRNGEIGLIRFNGRDGLFERHGRENRAFRHGV